MSTHAGHASLIGATFGPYQVQALVGRGAMGTVYLARDTILKRQVALKVLLGHLARNPLLVRRFHREAQATARLRHPNIVRIYAAGVEGGTPYIAMEFVEGEPLDRFLRRYGRLEWQRALHIGGQVAEAIAAAHAHGIVHRDVKPANIMLDLQGRVRLTDFGIAHVHAELEDGPPEESFLGTPRYMSPEQCANRGVGASTDLFSLGIVLFEMAAGFQPFQGESAVALIKRITNDDPPRLNKVFPDSPDDVARLVAHLLEKRPEDRPPNASDVVRRVSELQAENGGRSAMPDALTAFIRDQAQPRALPAGVSAQPSTGRDKTPVEDRPTPQRWRWRAMVSAAVLALSAVLPQAWLVLAGQHDVAYALPSLDTNAATDYDGTLRITLPATGLDVCRMAWQSDDTHLIVWTEGRVGTLTQGARGVMRLDADTGGVQSVMAPNGPALSPTAVRNDRLDVASYDLAIAEGRYEDVLAFASFTTTGMLRVTTYTADDADPAGSWVVPVASAASYPWAAQTSVGALHPEGIRYCTVESAGAEGAARLVEFDLSAEVGMTQRRVVVDPVASVESIQYAPSGDSLAYVERSRSGERKLMIVDRIDAPAPQRIATVAAQADVSFSPDGNGLVFTRNDGMLQLADLRSRRTADLGPGQVSRHAWHPSGAFVVALTANAGSAQIQSIETSAPYRTRTVRQLSHTSYGSPVISSDGVRAAMAVGTATGVDVMVVELDTRAKARQVAGL